MYFCTQWVLIRHFIPKYDVFLHSNTHPASFSAASRSVVPDKPKAAREAFAKYRRSVLDGRQTAQNHQNDGFPIRSDGARDFPGSSDIFSPVHSDRNRQTCRGGFALRTSVPVPCLASHSHPDRRCVIITIRDENGNGCGNGCSGNCGTGLRPSRLRSFWSYW